MIGCRIETCGSYWRDWLHWFASCCKEKPPLSFLETVSKPGTLPKMSPKPTILAVESDATGIFNIARGSRVTANQLVQLVLSIMGSSNVKPVYSGPRPGDVRLNFTDI